jgi:hypothetical protein
MILSKIIGGYKMVVDPNDLPKGDPQVISDTQGEEITPDNPEVVKQYPVDTTDKEQVEQVENTGK